MKEENVNEDDSTKLLLHQVAAALIMKEESK
jgi:hypothetical protein